MRGVRSARLLSSAIPTAVALALVLVPLEATGGAKPRPPPRLNRPTTGRVVTHPAIPAGYFYTVRDWHKPTEGKSPRLDGWGKPAFVLRGMVLKETVELTAASDMGGFCPADIARATRVLREPGSNNDHPFEVRTLNVLYRIQAHFKAEEIRVVSGYRTPVPGNTQGNHGRGRAVDFVVPGADDEDVARFARDIGFVGVGTYPLSGFVHVDVRPTSYFWRDTSGPGRKSREKGILADLAYRSDQAARSRGEAPPPPYVVAAGEAPPLSQDEDED